MSRKPGGSSERGELIWLTLAEARQKVMSKTISPLELTAAIFDRIAELNPRLRAFLAVDADRALVEAARLADELASGQLRGPLHGIPIGVKDHFATAGLRTTCASRIYADWIPDFDASVVARARAAGAVVFAKENMYELGTGWGTHGFFPVAISPWDPARSPGGSSSGSAVAVATGMSLASIASDGGGSVRVPSNYCGVTGLKPTNGRASFHGSIPTGPHGEIAKTVSTVGAIARTARDTAILLGVIAGRDPKDPTSLDAPVPDFEGYLTGTADNLTIGVPRGYLVDNLLPENGDAFEASLSVMERAGARVRTVAAPSMLDEVARSWQTVAYAEMAAFFGERFAACPDDFGPELQSRIAEGLRTHAVDYFFAEQARLRLASQFRDLLHEVDLLALPTAPGPPPTMAELSARAGDLGNIGQLARYTRPFNLTGMPAITVPGGFTRDGLPLGFEIAGRHLEEGTLLRAADAYQRLTDWHSRRPPAESG